MRDAVPRSPFKVNMNIPFDYNPCPHKIKTKKYNWIINVGSDNCKECRHYGGIINEELIVICNKITTSLPLANNLTELPELR